MYEYQNKNVILIKLHSSLIKIVKFHDNSSWMCHGTRCFLFSTRFRANSIIERTDGAFDASPPQLI